MFFGSSVVTGIFSRLLARSTTQRYSSIAGIVALLCAGTGGLLLAGVGFRTVGLMWGVALISLPWLIGLDSLWSRLSCVLSAAGLAYLSGFKIHFARLAFSEHYMYFTLLAVPVTLTWLTVIARSVEFLARELEERRWHLFLVILAFMTTIFLLLVAVQAQPELDFGFKLGISLLGAYLAVALFVPRAPHQPLIASQLGFLLGVVAITGVVKSLTTMVVITPIAVLALPTASRSLGLVNSSRPGFRNNALIKRATEYIGSFGLGIVSLYLSCGYFGVAIACYLWQSNPVTLALMISTGIICPLLLYGSRNVVRALDSRQVRIRSRQGRANLFGVEFDDISLSQAAQELENKIDSTQTSYVATPDVTALMKSRSNSILRRAFQRAVLVTPDGEGIVWASQLLNHSLTERVAGIDLMERFFDRDPDCRVFLLGAKPGVAQQAASAIDTESNDIRVVGTHHGYFDRQDSPTILQQINDHKPDILFVGLGVPDQEEWILHHIDRLEASVVMGIGGSLDVFSGELTRAPDFLQKLGLEWTYRIILEPRRIWRARLIPLFMKKFIVEKMRGKLKQEIL